MDANTISLRRTLRFNFAWACLLAAAFLFFFVNLPIAATSIPLAASLGFVAASIAALRFNRIGLLAVIAIVFLIVLLNLPITLLNLWMMATNHPLYLDSPATGIVVLINLVFFCIPAASLLVRFGLQRRAIRECLRATGKAKASSDISTHG